MNPEVSAPSDASELRARWAADWLDAGGVARRLGVVEADVDQLRHREAVLAVWWPEHQRFVYPPFQFDDRGVVRHVRDVLAHLPRGDGSGWERALWFLMPHARLRSRSPAEWLADKPEQVVAAAAHEFSGDPQARL